jgi:hypothetical protein
MLSLLSDYFLVSMTLAWLGTVAAVARDAQARVRNRAATRAAAATAFVLPFVGALVWLCVRPAETRVERRERRLRTAELQRLLAPPVLATPAAPAREREPAQAA